MNKVMKIAIIILVFMLSFTIIMVFGNSENTQVTEISGESKLEIVVMNSNISINSTDEKVITYEYKKEFFEVVEDKINEEDKKITINLLAGAKPNYNDRFIINIPNGIYNDLVVRGNKSGIGIGSFDMNVDIVNEDGSVSIVLPNEHNLKLKSVNGSGSLYIGEHVTDYTLKMYNKEATVVIPFGDYDLGVDEYQHIEGEGTSKIELSIEKSSFVITNK